MTRRELIDFYLMLPGAYEDYPFGEDWTLIQHSATRKSFVFIYERNGVQCVNLKCNPIDADFFRQIYHDVAPAYHMNKTHWNTVTLGGDVPEDELCRMIEHSYGLIKPKLKNRR
ncbi:MmcQ/YjbR family DNA-binding protein [Lachnospiraceae bacterium ZAX-1]